MYIPLDYYRILGLPIQATPDQLRQAHRDRSVQLLRREYSDVAIASRKYILDTAYGLLSDPAQRQTYDSHFLSKTYELAPDAGPVGAGLTMGMDVNTPSIEVPDSQLVGVLLILQELGEYELVLKLGRPFLTGGSASLRDGQFGDPNLVYPDVVLTVALACLELGREQWQQGQYENAAEALETGQQLLLREGFFVGVRGEIQSDLYKLRPYRVLELLALPEQQVGDRRQGMSLLRDMLQDRGGIDGTGQDHSGLGVDDFLRFMQQLRSHVTAAEQQILFEEEAQRPSAVATYLAVYALLARGFAERQPALIRRAKLLLLRLSNRQDVHLEQSVCALLLGQTEEASRALDLSQEYEPISFIREHSQGSPDLLPGLCLYAEHWLRDEVFPHFRDLSQRQVSLKEYFADADVQVYLEELPNESEVASADWSLAQAQERAYASSSRMGARSSKAATPTTIPQPATLTASAITSDSRVVGNAGVVQGREDTDALIAAAKSRVAAAGAAAVTAAGAAAVMRTDSQDTLDGEPPVAVRQSEGRSPSVATTRLASNSLNSDSGISAGERRRARRSSKRPILGYGLLRVGGLLLGLALLGVGLSALVRGCQSATTRTATPSPSATATTTPAAPPTPVNPAALQTLDNAAAEKILKTWLEAKAEAMGPNYSATELANVLTEPKLSYWQNAATSAKQENWYKKYKHDVKVITVRPSPQSPDQVEVSAEVSETEEFYATGAAAEVRPAETLTLRYTLVRKDGLWRIADWR